MDELSEEIEHLSRIDYYPPEKRIGVALKTISTLHTRLESTKAARRDAQESRFGLIIQNEELGADLADARARLENAEQAEKAAAIWEQRCSQATALSGNHLADLAAALRCTEQAERERDALRARLESAHALLRDTREISEFWFYVPKALQERYRVALESKE